MFSRTEPVEWRPMDRRMLLTVFRCGLCGALVVDIDRCLHEEHHEHERAA